MYVDVSTRFSLQVLGLLFEVFLTFLRAVPNLGLDFQDFYSF
jgi:hypothetical protein